MRSLQLLFARMAAGGGALASTHALQPLLRGVFEVRGAAGVGRGSVG